MLSARAPCSTKVSHTRLSSVMQNCRAKKYRFQIYRWIDLTLAIPTRISAWCHLKRLCWASMEQSQILNATRVLECFRRDLADGFLLSEGQIRIGATKIHKLKWKLNISPSVAEGEIMQLSFDFLSFYTWTMDARAMTSHVPYDCVSKLTIATRVH